MTRWRNRARVHHASCPILPIPVNPKEPVAPGMSASTGGERHRTLRNVTNPPRKRNQVAVTRESERAISAVATHGSPARIRRTDSVPYRADYRDPSIATPAHSPGMHYRYRRSEPRSGVMTYVARVRVNTRQCASAVTICRVDDQA